MAEVKTMRLNKVLREFNISLDRAVEYLSSKGYEVESRPTTKISSEEYQILLEEFQKDKSKKVASKEVGEEKRKEKEEIRIASERELEEKQKKIEASKKLIKAEVKLKGPKTLGKIDLEGKTAKPKEEKSPQDKKDVITPANKEISVKNEETTEIKISDSSASKIIKKEISTEKKEVLPVKEQEKVSAPTKKETNVK